MSSEFQSEISYVLHFNDDVGRILGCKGRGGMGEWRPGTASINFRTTVIIRSEVRLFIILWYLRLAQLHKNSIQSDLPHANFYGSDSLGKFGEVLKPKSLIRGKLQIVCERHKTLKNLSRVRLGVCTEAYGD